jgi:hypothetical protein
MRFEITENEYAGAPIERYQNISTVDPYPDAGKLFNNIQNVHPCEVMILAMDKGIKWIFLFSNSYSYQYAYSRPSDIARFLIKTSFPSKTHSEAYNLYL